MEEVRAFGWCISAASRGRILPDFSSAHPITFACPWVADFASYMHACGRLLYIFSSNAVIDFSACQGLFGMDNAMRFICFCEPTITNLSTSGPRHWSGQRPIDPHVPTEPWQNSRIVVPLRHGRLGAQLRLSQLLRVHFQESKLCLTTSWTSSSPFSLSSSSTSTKQIDMPSTVLSTACPITSLSSSESSLSKLDPFPSFKLLRAYMSL